MLYRLVRPVARYVLGYYFRNIDVSGLENIPRDAPVILAANHPTAFIEPCLLACFQTRSLHFLARGDLFKTKVATFLLRALNILPVFRIQDGGYGKLTENYTTFEECAGVLQRSGALMVLAEGRCIHEKRLRPLRKGTARIALSTLAGPSAPEEIYIVPVGVNFVAAERVRTTVMIRCGEPILTSDLLPIYRENEAKGITAFTAALADRLTELVIQLPDPATDANYEAALTVARTSLPLRPTGITHTGTQLHTELSAVARYTPTDHRYPTLVREIEHAGFPVDTVARGGEPVKFPLRSVPALALLLPQLPLWLLAELIARVGPKTIEFYSPVRFAVIAVGTMLYLPLLLLIPWADKIYLLLSVAFTPWSIKQVEAAMDWYYARRRGDLTMSMQTRLLALRAELLD